MPTPPKFGGCHLFWPWPHFFWPRELRDAGIVIAGGFHSPMEQECLGFLLRGNQPLIICPARHPPTSRFSSEWKRAIESGRLLFLSPFDASVRRTAGENAQLRNEFVAAFAAAIMVPHASEGGKVKAVVQTYLERGRTVFTFEGDENAELISHGAVAYSLVCVREHLRPGKMPSRRLQ